MNFIDLKFNHLSQADLNNILIDLIYNPIRTKFMENGLNKGCLVSNGEKMLINQAEKSWILWNR